MTSLISPRYAGFWLRAIAAFLDLIVLAVALAVFVSFLSVAKGIPLAFLALHPGESANDVVLAFGRPALRLMLGFFVVSSWLYFAVSESAAWQGTIGKKIVGLYVADALGNRATFARTSVRFVGGRLLFHVPYCGPPFFGVDCICAGLTPRKQAFHDLVSGCVVLRRAGGSPLFNMKPIPDDQ